MVFHYIDTMDYFPQYRLHTPAEVVKRNHVSRWEVVRDVVIQQVIQTIVGVAIAATEPDTFVGKDDFNVAVWAQRIRLVQGVVPTILSTVGVDSRTLATKIVGQAPSLAAVLMGGQHPWAVTIAGGALVPTFAQWELLLAKAIYWVAIPFFQFTMAILIVDTWQYFLHRAMHMNKWLYSEFPLNAQAFNVQQANHAQQPSTHAIIGYTFHTPTVHSTTTPLKAFFSTPSVPALHIS